MNEKSMLIIDKGERLSWRIARKPFPERDEGQHLSWMISWKSFSFPHVAIVRESAPRVHVV